MSNWSKISLQAAKAWFADDAFGHAAAVSFCTLFSLAPVTIIAVTVAGFFLGQDAAGQQLQAQVTQLMGPASAELVTQAAAASRTEGASTWATVLGIVLVVVGATTVFGQLQAAMNDLWGVRTKPSKSGWVVLLLHRLVSFAMVLTVGFLLVVSLVFTTLLSSAFARFGGSLEGSEVLLKGTEFAVSLMVVVTLFALLFKIMPDVKLPWREVWLGAAVTAVLFTIGRYLIALYLAHSTIASVYGTAGSLVALLIWIYYSCAILFYGVEFIRAYRDSHHLPVEPKETAVVVREEVVQTSPG